MQDYSIYEIDFEKGVLKTMEGRNFLINACEYSGLRAPPIRNGIPTKRRMIPTSFLHAIRRNVLSVRK